MQADSSHIKKLNEDADEQTTYKVVFIARHGQGYHNVVSPPVPAFSSASNSWLADLRPRASTEPQHGTATGVCRPATVT